LISGIEERVVDDRGRLYLSRRLRGKKLYMKIVGGVVILAEDPEELESIARAIQEKRNKVVEEYLALIEELGEPSIEELEGAVREAAWLRAQKAT